MNQENESKMKKAPCVGSGKELHEEKRIPEL